MSDGRRNGGSQLRTDDVEEEGLENLTLNWATSVNLAYETSRTLRRLDLTHLSTNSLPLRSKDQALKANFPLLHELKVTLVDLAAVGEFLTGIPTFATYGTIASTVPSPTVSGKRNPRFPSLRTIIVHIHPTTLRSSSLTNISFARQSLLYLLLHKPALAPSLSHLIGVVNQYDLLNDYFLLEDVDGFENWWMEMEPSSTRQTDVNEAGRAKEGEEKMTVQLRWPACVDEMKEIREKENIMMRQKWRSREVEQLVRVAEAADLGA
ncbi:hypothetical protein BT69DRAFT_43301 [Atractiella rhizophila]|nr:hypothetical protein BT69DRAFT_43301 [Atractiella rhizophila]